MSEAQTNLRYIYGPVHSWRSGTSLGVDIIGDVSTCSFNCVYCQLGKIQKITNEIKIYVPTQQIIQDLMELERSGQFSYEALDVITFAGSGEPTLAENLDEAIEEIRKLYASRAKQVPISILTNATMLCDPQVRERVSKADLVSLKLDAVNDEMLRMVNQPAPGISIGTIIQGIKALREVIDDADKLQLQIMMMPKYLHAGGGILTVAALPQDDNEHAALPQDDKKVLAPQDDRLDSTSDGGLLRYAHNDGKNTAPRNDGNINYAYLDQLADLIAETQVRKIQINTPTRPKPVSKTGEYWIDTRGNHYGPGHADEMKPEYIEFRELPVISKEDAFAIEDYLRNALKDRILELEVVNVYKR